MVKAVSSLLLVGLGLAAAFSPVPVSIARSTRVRLSTEVEGEPADVPAGRNPDRPELPEIKGDYDWDAKFAGDPDWITENVPGKIVLNEVELAAQVAALGNLEEKWRKERMQKEYDEARILGWTARAETYNGRFAMFFLVVGLLTEYWTGVTIPGQIEEMLRVGGFIGPDY
eukprot:CAMPEP_0183307708 /NCGR_PEP_ID=MMETSP0160_2-20130417/18869_1 /TAXON_ID=2839 ORGANISM="Odontella Sinensis, Strain Grunow 1884" /NCGR_SAMPLE_ID=MMETSP0160_2 /ASSEMBLY_ACC=CAM_ASM_000250 /LENGTH=170 /DNA_ID=CAMNT_0025471355 /DNA_START=75 /DNA_END=587 /DNA_ORIENTATION=+